MESSVVSLVLAQALTELPKITAAELYERCAGKIGTVTLAQFRPELGKWLTDGTIPGYEARLGRTGGIYKKGAAMVSLVSNAAEKVQLDPIVVIAAIKAALETAPRITAGDLFKALNLLNTTEAQFRLQLNQLFNDGDLTEFESRKGKTGGIYLRGSESEKWVPEASDDNEAEEAGSFTVQITPTLKVVQSDERNWTIQKLNGNTWVNKGYHPDIKGCLKSVVKHAMNGEFKLSNNLVQLKDLASVFSQMEGRLMAQVEKHVSVQA